MSIVLFTAAMAAAVEVMAALVQQWLIIEVIWNSNCSYHVIKHFLNY